MTQEEIARMLGVSKATVSLALSDSPRVKSATRERVKKFAHQFNYRPSEIARSLVLKKTNTVGAIIPSFSNSFYVELIEELQQVLRKANYFGIFVSGKDDRLREREIDSLIQRGVDGLICFEPKLSEILRLVANGPPPLVIYNPLFEPSELDMVVNNIAVDKYGGAVLAMEHLIRHGHKGIAFLGVSKNLEPRYAGYKDTLLKYGIPFKREWVLDEPGYYDNGYMGIKQILLLNNRPSAVFAMNDALAIGAMKAVAEHGLKVPDDIAVIGFDNIEIGKYLSVPLTTVKQPKSDIITNVVGVLMSEIKKENGEKKRKTVIRVELIVRDSCGCKGGKIERRFYPDQTYV